MLRIGDTTNYFSPRYFPLKCYLFAIYLNKISKIGRCYYGESLGEFCQIDGLCEATVPNAECRTTCQCSEGKIIAISFSFGIVSTSWYLGYIPSWDKSRCLQIAVDGLNSSCEENVQWLVFFFKVFPFWFQIIPSLCYLFYF